MTVDLDGNNIVTVDLTGDVNDTMQGIENIIATAGVDNITGDASNNSFTSASGNDILVGEGGDDVLDAGTGNDTLDGGDGNDILTGGNNNDMLTGGAGNDTLNGDSGDDDLTPGTGSDILNGGANLDTVYFNAGGNGVGGIIDGATGSGTVFQGGDTNTLTSIEAFNLTSQNDLLTFDTDFTALSEVNALAGSDTINITDNASGDNLTDAGLDGNDFANIFNGVETLDFSDTSISNLATFEIGNEDIAGILGATTGVLSINIDTATIDLTDFVPLGQNGETFTSTTTGNTRTIEWSNNVDLIIYG